MRAHTLLVPVTASIRKTGLYKQVTGPPVLRVAGDCVPVRAHGDERESVEFIKGYLGDLCDTPPKCYATGFEASV